MATPEVGQYVRVTSANERDTIEGTVDRVAGGYASVFVGPGNAVVYHCRIDQCEFEVIPE